MKFDVDFLGYNRLIQPTEWRYSSATLGLKKYLDFISEFDNKKYILLEELRKENKELPPEAISGFDGILYNSEDITEEKYFEFVEKYFESEMTHIKIIKNIEKFEDLDDKGKQDIIKVLNDYTKSKTVLKGILKEKFDGTNGKYYIDTINSNRTKIVKEIYRYSPLMYRGFNNINLLFTDSNNHSRLQNYTVDENRKTRYLGYSFDKDTFVGEDIQEFDFIPFAFTKTYESYFINNNFSIGDLEQTNLRFSDYIEKSEEKNSTTKLYQAIKNSDEYINFDVEVIIKPRDKEQYQTLFVRAEKLEALRKLDYKNLKFYYKINDDFYFNLEKEIYERCLNDVILDDTIEFMLKAVAKQENGDTNTGRLRTQIYKAIKINEKWKGVLEMKEIERARVSGFYISKKFIEDKNQNKLNSYKQKLISAIVAHDYSRMNEILLSLSSYANTELSFAYALFENPEKNIGLAYSFANALTSSPTDKPTEDTDEKKESE